MKMDVTINQMMANIGSAARAASAELATATAESKRAALVGAADAVWESRNQILNANTQDMAFGREKGLSAAMMDRLLAE